jgi:hypothetical protein
MPEDNLPLGNVNATAPNTLPVNIQPKRNFLVPILLFIIVLLISLIIITVIYSLERTKQRAENQSSQKTFTIRLNHPAIESAEAVYSFIVKAQEVREIAEGILISPEDQDGNLPDFLVTDKTNLINESQEKVSTAEAELSSLKSGQNLKINASFNVDSRKWNINEVVILP